MEIYTIGHSNRSMKEFLKLLKAHSVGVVIDVRRFPTSKKFPHFSMRELEKELKRNGVKYVWLGEELGGFRKGGYAEYVRTPEFDKGINKVLRIVREYAAGNCRVAVMCSEKLWFRCHRRFIADALVEKGVRVVHIIEEGIVQEHKRRD